jgi:hypothetical protein
MNNGCDKFYIHLTLATVIMRLYLGHRKQNGAKGTGVSDRSKNSLGE